MKIRRGMSAKERLQMIGFGALAFFGCLWLYPHVGTDAGQSVLIVGVILGATSVVGGIIGLQDHKL